MFRSYKMKAFDSIRFGRFNVRSLLVERKLSNINKKGLK